jgi:RND family efflux transporter MFP subunit
MRSYALVIAALLGASCIAAAADPVANSQTEIAAISKPSQDRTLSFVRPGQVATLKVKEGDSVKEGDVVATQENSEEQAIYEISKAQAEDNTRTEAQEKVRDMKQKTYERKKATGTATAMELDEAFLDWQVGLANVKLSTFEHVQDDRKAKKDKASLEKTILKSPISGTVVKTWINPGENVDNQNMKVMRIINIDPLWVDVSVPFATARTLKLGDRPTVTLSDKEARTGKVTFIAPEADAGSNTIVVRVEVENRAKTPAGERVTVSFAKNAKVATGEEDKH